MKVTSHIAVGAVLSIPVMLVEPEGAILFFLTSILVDVDHLLFYCFHEKTISVPLLQSIEIHKKWPYFGPRVHVFHNYETLLFTAIAAWIFGGFFIPVFLGVLLHLFCDQASSIHSARYLRIKSLFGDIIRYIKYTISRQRGDEKDYMTHRRNTWWNHLRKRLPGYRFESAKTQYGILYLYPDIPIKTSEDSGNWNRFF